MKKTHAIFSFLIIVISNINSIINASDRRTIRRQVQLGLIQSFYDLAYSKKAVTQDDIRKECIDRDLKMHHEEIYKSWLFVKALPENKDLSDCLIVSYRAIKYPDEKSNPKTLECQNMIHNFFQAQDHFLQSKSDK